MSEKWSHLGQKLWSEAGGPSGTLLEVYFNSRGIQSASWPEALRYHPNAPHPKLVSGVDRRGGRRV